MSELLTNSDNLNPKEINGTGFVAHFLTTTLTGKDVNGWERPIDKDQRPLSSLDDFPFYISYQDQIQTCYTRKEIYDNLNIHPNKVMRKFDRVTIDMNTLVEEFGTLDTLRIYLHNPGQFIRGIGKELVEGKISQIGPDNRNNWIHVTISQIGNVEIFRISLIFIFGLNQSSNYIFLFQTSYI